MSISPYIIILSGWLLFLLSGSLLAACEVPAKVIAVIDGDSIKVLDAAKEQHQIRFMAIDAPEKGQAYGKAAKKYLKKLLANTTVCLEPIETDRYNRIVAKVLLSEIDVGLAMIDAGYAWHYKTYAKNQPATDQALYTGAELQAKLSVIGLWSEPNPTPPWEWRRGGKRKVRPASVLPSLQGGDFTCGQKRFCKQMSSCEEACFYLNQCQLGRLDRDKDNIPCESFCGGCS